MAANDELPRGLTLSDLPAAGNPASVVFPATPGIAWVLTYVYGDADSQPTAGAFGSQVIATDGVQTIILFQLYDPSGLGNYTLESGTWSGSVAFGIGKAVTVKFNNSQAAIAQSLNSAAYPI